MNQKISRRRFIKIAAANSVGIFFVNSSISAKLFSSNKPIIWNGIVLGTDASMTLYHDDQTIAKKLLNDCHKEILRLEKIFTLYDNLSSLSQLNQNGSIKDSPPELLDIFTKAKAYGELTNGAFDITIHPLSELYSSHFNSENPNPNGPSSEQIKSAIKKVGYRAIEILDNSITFKNSGMIISLNGIAQGYITDRVTEILKDAGMKNVLVEIGEKRALGNHPEERPWQIGISSSQKSNVLVDSVKLENRAMATSGGYGTVYDVDGKFHHLINPRDGKPVHHYSSVTVLASDATTADALSTGLSVMNFDQGQELLKKLSNIDAIFILKDGTLFRS